MARTIKDAVRITKGLMIFVDWISNLGKEVKELGGNEKSLYKFFTNVEKRKEVARIVVKRSQVFGNKYLELVKTSILKECDGLYILKQSDDLFGWVDLYFDKWGTNKAQNISTEEVMVGLYNLIKKSTFSQFFNSATDDLDRICFTHDQIRKWVKENKKDISPKWTFFLSKSGSRQYFVVSVNSRPDGTLDAHVFKLEGTATFGSGYHVVLPH